MNKLTELESKIMHLVAEGNDNKGIADTLYMSKSSIKSYLTKIYQKLGVSNRVQAVILALKNNLINCK